ncbi:MAG TPA: acyltransferase [Terracidiphilus sp.]|nr:acyltransferase [Terracidiphilus sp.]
MGDADKGTGQVSPSRRIAALDGWRGIAILLVVFDHFQDSLLGHYAYSWTQTGIAGVTVFFVLSGYLITSNLLKGTIDLKKFYVRRFFRLMPTAWTYLAFLMLMGFFLGWPFITDRGLLGSLFFYRNFLPLPLDLSGHFWSLSIEEQFYLIWPGVLLLAGVKRAKWLVIAGVIVIAALRLSAWTYYNGVSAHTQVRADALLWGCLLAILLSGPEANRIARLLRWSFVPALAVFLYFALTVHPLSPLPELAAIATMIGFAVTNPRHWSVRLISTRSLAWVGTVSYSVYVWQEFFMQYRSVWALFVAMPLFAIASYYLIERPCNRFGHRITARSAVLADARKNEAEAASAGALN